MHAISVGRIYRTTFGFGQGPAMLRIYRYLVTASGALLLLALVLIAWFYNHQATRDLIDLTARHNIAMDRILSNTIWGRYGPYLAAAENMDGATLRSRPETAEIAAAIRDFTEGIPVLKVKIYSPGGKILFSTTAQEIGDDYSTSEALQLAVREARTSSELSYTDHFSAFSGETFHRDVVETYIPKTDAAGAVIGVAELYTDVSDATEQITRSTWHLAIVLSAIIGVTYAVLAAGIMRRAIEPVQLASRRAAEIGPDSPGLRLATEGMPREILPLIRAVNGALDRLDQALDSQRRFTADAAHELLTPLAVLRAQIDAEGPGSGMAPLRQDVDAMTEMVSQLLMLAELESRGAKIGPSERTDLHAAATDVVTGLAPLAVQDRKELALTGADGPVWVQGSPRMLGRALRNLVENALAHTPPGTTVEVRLAATGEVRVIDQGPGVPPERREAVFQRFWRGDRVSRPGAGLGLSIVRRIAEQAGGKVWIEDAAGGGASFVLQLAKAAAGRA